jgi:CubicO group peptidase (beta-lactamase class C family)
MRKPWRLMLAIVCALVIAHPAIAACRDLPKAGNVRALGWDPTKLLQARDAARAQNADTFVVITRGKIVLADGDLRAPMLIASMRKSIASALVGQAVADGKIQLDAPISRYGIDDPIGLTDAEKSTTVANLLHARSGVYVPAAAESARMKELRPKRESHAPGSFWYYNNWDFNALGDVFERATGKPIAVAFSSRIAEPLCMQDFDLYRDSFQFYDFQTPRFPAYHFRLSTRDTLRFGLLYLNQGRIGDRQIVAQDWVRETTATISKTNDAAALFGGYGGLWWTAVSDAALPAVLDGAYTASGFAGQQMTIIPKIDTIILTRARERPEGKSTLGNFVRWQAQVLKTLEARTE